MDVSTSKLSKEVCWALISSILLIDGFTILLNELKKKGVENCRLEGASSNDWKLIDAIDIIVHIFHPEKRKFYNLERMWSELIPKERLTIW